jgi:hypothetical protein
LIVVAGVGFSRRFTGLGQEACFRDVGDAVEEVAVKSRRWRYGDSIT